MLNLGILDFCPCTDPASRAAALAHTASLAEAADKLGFSRFWLAEHHSKGVGHSCPEVLIPVLLNVTTRIRIGSGGVLLRYHHPSRLAQVFRVLGLLAPNRVDAGLARGGSSVLEAVQYHDGAAPIDYQTRVRDFVAGLAPTVHDGQNSLVEVWLLGSGGRSSELAAAHGTRLCSALFLPAPPSSIEHGVSTYFDNFASSLSLAKPHHAIAVAGVCAKTIGEAHKQFGTWKATLNATIFGDGPTCRSAIETEAQRFRASEVLFLDASPDPNARLESYSRLSDAFELNRGQSWNGQGTN